MNVRTNRSQRPSTRSALPLALAATLLGLAWVGPGNRALAATPSPSPEPTEETLEDFEMEAWLDAPLPLDARPGTTIHETPAWLIPGLIVIAMAGLLIASGVTRRR